MIGSWNRPGRRLWHGIAALLLLAGLAANGARAAAPNPATAQNRLEGSVLIAGGGPAAAAIVVAQVDDTHARATIDSSGAYSMTLQGGDWRVTVVAPQPSTISPTWVYTGEAQLVSFDGNPDPISPTRQLDFTAMPASATVTGRLIAPGGATFDGSNKAWVRAHNQEGQGNTAQVAPDGTFAVHMLPGNTLLSLALENQAWAPPTTLAGMERFVADGESWDAGDLTLIEKQASITGAVLDEDGHAITGIPVRAWRLDGSEVAETISDAGGNYTIHVISGTWELRATPPLTSTFVAAQPPQRVVLPNDTAQRIQALRVANADVTISGQVVDSTTSTLIGSIRGRVFALYDREHPGRWEQLGPAAPIVDGRFTLKLSSHVANTYAIRAFFPQSQGYTALKQPPISVSAGQTIANYTLPAAPNNSSISGHFNSHDTGEPQLGLPGIVYAASDNGGVARDRLNPLDGSYAIDVAAVDTFGHGGSFWRVRGFVDPTSGYAVQRPRVQRVFLPYNGGNGAEVAADFTVARLDAAIAGRVTDAQGQPLPGAKVGIRELSAPAGEALTRWTLAGPDGRYRVRVTAGTYVVRADFRNLVQPQPQTVTVASGATARADLHFRLRNAVIAGQVTYEGTGHTAFVRARSDSGAHIATLAGPNGHYELHVNAGDTWHIQAVSEAISGTTTATETVFLKSERLDMTPQPGPNTGNDLSLEISDSLPDAVAMAFDASEDQQLTLSDGSQLIIPSGALAPDGPVVVTVRPLAELADDGDTQPVAFGYRVHAFDASHRPITHFNTPVTIALPFTAEQLDALGVTADQLVPAYWDEATASWKPVENVSVEVDDHGGGVVSIAVDHFTDYALLAGSDGGQVFLPLIAR
jgi:hypothetical protein